MPDTSFAIKVLRVFLEYTMLFFLIAFVVKIYHRIFKRTQQLAKEINKPTVNSSQAILTIVESSAAELIGSRYAFTDEINIGRSSDNDIVIAENFVSHHHARIFFQGNQYIIEDLGSINHTYLNNQVLQGKTYLRTGDLVRIGMVTLRFER